MEALHGSQCLLGMMHVHMISIVHLCSTQQYGEHHLLLPAPLGRLLPSDLLHRPRQRRLHLSFLKRRDIVISRCNVLKPP